MRSFIRTLCVFTALIEAGCNTSSPPADCATTGAGGDANGGDANGGGANGGSANGGSANGGKNTGGKSAGGSNTGGMPEEDGGGMPNGGAGGSGGVSSGGSGNGGTSVGGTPSGSWTNVTGNIAGLKATCGNLGYISAKPDEDVLLIDVSGFGLYSSTTGGTTWNAIGTATKSLTQNFNVGDIAYDPDDPKTYWVSGTHYSPGVVKTTDDGKNFVDISEGGKLSNNDSISIDFSDPDRKTLLAGTHEGSNVVWRSTDGGNTWDNVGMNLPTDTKWSLFTWVVDSETHLVGLAGTGTVGGIFRTADGGKSWKQVSKEGGGQQPLIHSDGSAYWTSEGDGGMVRSTDQGATWEHVTDAGVIYSIPPIELPDGRIATCGSKGVLVSDDQGKSWTNVAPPEPFNDPGHYFHITYSKFQKAFFVAEWTCSPNDVPADGVARFDWDYEKQ